MYKAQGGCEGEAHRAVVKETLAFPCCAAEARTGQGNGEDTGAASSSTSGSASEEEPRWKSCPFFLSKAAMKEKEREVSL